MYRVYDLQLVGRVVMPGPVSMPFEHEAELYVRERILNIFIQTDKGTYKPRQLGE